MFDKKWKGETLQLFLGSGQRSYYFQLRGRRKNGVSNEILLEIKWESDTDLIRPITDLEN